MQELFASPYSLALALVQHRERGLLRKAEEGVSSQVYVPIGRPGTPAADLTGDRSRSLASKLEGFLDVVAYCMRDEWGGATRDACAERMLAAAKQLSGGVEM